MPLVKKRKEREGQETIKVRSRQPTEGELQHGERKAAEHTLRKSPREQRVKEAIRSDKGEGHLYLQGRVGRIRKWHLTGRRSLVLPGSSWNFPKHHICR